MAHRRAISWMAVALALCAAGSARVASAQELFSTSESCVACHNGLMTPKAEDISFGTHWRASMMANAARDPYWHAAVRREIMDYPDQQREIEHECTVCHMPMAHTEARVRGERAKMFAHLPIGRGDTRADRLAADGVSCTMCHQITPAKLGTRESFTGGFVVDSLTRWEHRRIFGPFAVDSGRTRVMHSATGFVPREATHLAQSEVCATCHMLYTHARGPDGRVIGQFPEQTPYLEWRYSAFRNERSCQSCHMPVVRDSVAIASVVGVPRPDVNRHDFRGGNFFMLRMLNRYRDELGVEALPQELEAAASNTVAHLQDSTARVSVSSVAVANGRVVAEVVVQNLAGHKFPTAYPSRRAWLHVTVRDGAGRTVFESGRLLPSGAVVGNDNDEDPARHEPHHTEITRREQVQIYESIMGDTRRRVTTGLLSGVVYLKDNRLLPRGFDKAGAIPDIAVYGGARDDADFVAGSDRVRYAVSVGNAAGPMRVDAELWFQPIGFRWADNLRAYRAPETDRFVRWYDALSEITAVLVARGSATTAR